MNTTTAATIALTATCGECEVRAAALAQQLNLPLVDNDELHNYELILFVTPERLELGETTHKAPKPIYVDFLGGSVGHRHRFGGGRGQPIAKAVGLKGGANPSVIDATAGLGRDAFLLASLGCHVTLIERSPIVAALLRDGLERAADDASVSEVIERMNLIEGDAAEVIRSLSEDNIPDVIYLDPMFPGRDKSALVKKEMRLFHHLIGPDQDSSALLEAALGKAKRRVVVKRPKSAAPLDGPKPSAEISSKAMRYDLYVTLTNKLSATQ